MKQHKDVMEAAERIFDGSFDDIVDDDGDVEMAELSDKSNAQSKKREIVSEGPDSIFYAPCSSLI